MVSSRLKEDKQTLTDAQQQQKQLSRQRFYSLTSPFTGFVEILVGVNLFQAEIFLFNPESKQKA